MSGARFSNGVGGGAVLLALLLGACGKPPPPGFPATALDQAIGNVIGDPTTCVLVARINSEKVVYRYGQSFNCARGLPACDRPGTLSADGALALATTPGGRHASCPTTPDGSRSVGWAEGEYGGLIYSAVMEGQRALPGEEMTARLEAAFKKAGL
jgi:hypothetical protein